MIRIRGRVIIFFLFAIITLNFIILPARAASAVAGSGAAQNTSYAKAAANIQSAGSNPKIILAKIATKNDVSIKNITHSPLVLDRKNCAYEPVKGRTALHIQTDVRIAADYITFSRAVIDGDLYIESNNIFLKDLTIKGSIMVSPDSEGIMKLNNVTYSGIKIYEDNKADKRMQSFPEKSGRDGAGGTGGKGGADGAGAAGVTSTGKAGRAGFDMAGGIGTDKVSRAGADRTGNDAAYAADTVNASGIDKNTGVNCIDGEAGGLVNSVSDVNAGNIGEISGAAKLAGDSGSASAADIADTAGIAGTTDDTADNAGATDTADAAGAANATGAADISGTAVPGNAGTADPAGKSSGGPESKATTPEKVLLELITIDSNNSNLIIVNKSRSLPADWKPKDLAVLRVPYHGRPEARYMRKEAADALAKLFSKAKKDRIELSAISGFRSYELQKLVHAMYVSKLGAKPAGMVSATPGNSEHQTGLAVDISSRSVKYRLSQSFGNTREGKWLSQNAAKFGFIIRYPAGKEAVTGYSYEPWHIRYVGTDLAEDIMKKNLTLEEYFELAGSVSSYG